MRDDDTHKKYKFEIMKNKLMAVQICDKVFHSIRCLSFAFFITAWNVIQLIAAECVINEYLGALKNEEDYLFNAPMMKKTQWWPWKQRCWAIDDVDMMERGDAIFAIKKSFSPKCLDDALKQARKEKGVEKISPFIES